MLTGVMNFVVLQWHPVLPGRAFFRQVFRIRFETRHIFAGKKSDDTGRRLRSRDIDLNDTLICDRALYQYVISKPGSLKLRGVGCSARHFESAINTRERLSNLRRLHSSGEHRLPACSLRQLAANLLRRAIRGRYSWFCPASCQTLQAGSLRSPEICAIITPFPRLSSA